VLKVSTLAGQTTSPKAKGQQKTQKDGFQEVPRQKRRDTDKNTRTSEKAAVQNKTSPA
jgi:hypothetical protein